MKPVALKIKFAKWILSISLLAPFQFAHAFGFRTMIFGYSKSDIIQVMPELGNSQYLEMLGRNANAIVAALETKTGERVDYDFQSNCSPYDLGLNGSCFFHIGSTPYYIALEPSACDVYRGYAPRGLRAGKTNQDRAEKTLWFNANEQRMLKTVFREHCEDSHSSQPHNIPNYCSFHPEARICQRDYCEMHPGDVACRNGGPKYCDQNPTAPQCHR